mmetsp:Transcript_6198/g.6864  ORF Transcript_6198/g.6864 Transcript_6198/m.6864 type:complete len:94 (-) Transcript_6198:788-1069(-)
MSYVTPMSCGETTCATRARSCLSCASAMMSSRLRCDTVEDEDKDMPPEGEGLSLQVNARAFSRLAGCKYCRFDFLDSAALRLGASTETESCSP